MKENKNTVPISISSEDLKVDFEVIQELMLKNYRDLIKHWSKESIDKGKVI